MIRRLGYLTYRAARRVVVAVVGVTVVLIGVVMLLTPGPGLVVIPLGLAILSIEFAWAKLWLKRVRERLSEHGSGRRARKTDEQIARVRDE